MLNFLSFIAFNNNYYYLTKAQKFDDIKFYSKRWTKTLKIINLSEKIIIVTNFLKDLERISLTK